MERTREIIAGVRRFVDREIRPNARAFDQQEAVSRDLITKIAAAGYLAAPFPEEFGGLGLDPLSYGMLTEEVARGCSSVRTLLTVHCSLVGETLLRWGTAEQKARLLPAMARGEQIAAFALSEPDVGSDARSVATTFVRDGSHYVLNGRKKWISYGTIADVLLVAAARDGRVTTFLVEGARTSRVPIKGMLGVRGSHMAEITLADVEVSAADIVGPEGQGFEYVVQSALDFGRHSVAWGALGVAQEALETMVAYARSRKQFDAAIGSFQLVKAMIADAVAEIHAVRALCRHMASLRQSGELDAPAETCIAKYVAARAAVKVTSDAVQVLGANGCSDAYPVERLYRDAKIFEIIEGTSQIQQLLIAKYGLNKYKR